MTEQELKEEIKYWKLKFKKLDVITNQIQKDVLKTANHVCQNQYGAFGACFSEYRNMDRG